MIGKNIHQGLEWWDCRYKPIKFLINCVASKKAYGNMRHYLNKVKGFGDDNIVFPLYVQQQKDYVLLSRFWYKLPRGVEDDNDNKLGYYEGRTEIYGILFTFTVKKCDLLNLEDFDIERLYDHKNEWSRIEGGDKNNSVVHNNAHLANPTYLNDFTHINIPTANCVLLSVVSGLSALGFDKQAKQFFKNYHSSLHQNTTGLWNLITSTSRKFVPQLKFRVIVTPGGINGDQLMNMNNEWAIILRIQTMRGRNSHWICICGGMIYDSNSSIKLTKSISNLNLCAQLHVNGSTDDFALTKKVYRLIPHNMNLEGGGNPSWDTVLPKREGWQFYEKRECIICGTIKKQTEYSIKQWKWAHKGTGRCIECGPIK